MKLLKPIFWQKKNNIFSILLFPFTIIYSLIVIVRKIFSFPKKFNIPIICVGNIYIGGTGKTPLSVYIFEQIKTFKKPAIVKKFYSNHKDEHGLIHSKVDSLILNKSRSQGIRDAINQNFDVAILDDGFQDHSIKKNLNIICFNSNQLIGNGMLIPSGPLRESMTSLREAQIVIINGKKNIEFERKINEITKKVEIFYSEYLPLNIDDFRDKKLIAFAGIGNNENFFKVLKDNNLNVHKQIDYPDHYEFNKEELKKIIKDSVKNQYTVITTEKDYYRIKDFNFKEIKYLKLEISITQKDKLINSIKKYL